MKIYKTILHAMAVIALSLTSGLVLAQAAASQSNCTFHGGLVREPIGDREGHALQVSAATCAVTGGVLDGTVETHHAIYEHDKGASSLRSADSVFRKPGARAVARITAGTLEIVMKDGNPAGWTASGKGVYTMASGTAAPLAGKTFTYTARSTGPLSYGLDIVLD